MSKITRIFVINCLNNNMGTINVYSTHHRKNGNQQIMNTPMMIPKVLAALCSDRQLVAVLIVVPETKVVFLNRKFIISC